MDDDQHEYLERLEILEREIAMLESQVPRALPISKSPQRIDKSSGEPQDLDVVKSISKLQDELAFLVGVSGLQMTECLSSVIKMGEDYIEKGYTVCCNSYGHDATLNFVVTEKQLSKTESQANINSLEILVDDSHFSKAMKQQVVQIQEDCDISGFFRLWEKYNRYVQERKQVFSQIKDKHRSIEVKEGNMLKFHPAGQKDFEYRVHWELLISDISQVTPFIQLFVKAPKSVLSSESGSILHDAPKKFSQIVKSKGAHTAIDLLISTVTASS